MGFLLLGSGLPFVNIGRGRAETEGWRARKKILGEKAGGLFKVGLVESAVIGRPVWIPRATIVWYRIIAARTLADPKDGGQDAQSPRVPPWSAIECPHSAGRNGTVRRLRITARESRLHWWQLLFLLNPKKSVLAQLYGVLGEVSTALVLRLRRRLPAAECK